MEYTVTVKKVVKMSQTLTVTATSEREARRLAREMADENTCHSYGTQWRVTDVDVVAESEVRS